MVVALTELKGIEMSNLKLQTAASASCCGPDCCGGETKSQRPAEELTAAVRERYGMTAKGGLSSHDAGVRAVAEAFGYTADELAAIPAKPMLASAAHGAASQDYGGAMLPSLIRVG